MKVLVTGGAGFIGSHLCEELLSQGHEVFILDDLSTGSIDNIKHLKESSKFHPIFESIMNPNVLSDLIDQCDMIFHLAAVVGVKKVINSPVETIEKNVSGTEAILKFANIKKKKVFLTSTSEVYGKGNLESFSETDDLTLGPTEIQRWGYACSKAIDEFLALAYWKEYSLPVVIVRLFNIIGPRQTGRYGMVVPRFVSQAVNNKPITIYGDGNQMRCFLYVKEAVDAIVKLAFHEKAIGKVYNLGNPTSITMNDLAKLVVKITKSRSVFQHIPYEKCYECGFEDMQKRVPNIEKIKNLIGFEPKMTLTDIIKGIVFKDDRSNKKTHKDFKLYRNENSSLNA
jgi:UDP-glucose 4-epimerase